MPTYSIDLRRPHKTLDSSFLSLGGTSPSGQRLGANNYFLTLDGEPFFGISGEFHFSRFSPDYWEEELRKVKAGGVEILATYVFWMFHEERQGHFDWGGQHDLRRFVELCSKVGLRVVLRVGPFAHGEWRNGGLPDWLYGQPFEVRTNDPAYLALVERLYGEIAAQVRGLFFADGGPIIGIQLENEYMHAGAPWETLHPGTSPEWVPAGREGAGHLKELKAIADRVGLNAPYIFITAWGGAPILEGESLPVYGDYAYPVWLERMPLSGAYVFRDYHSLPVDQPTHRVPEIYPYLTAELQGGIQITARSRPIVPARSTEAMALVRLGGGANYIGYYMYHGGTTPSGRHGYSNEHACPRLSYDFQAPVGEYGRLSPGYHGIKLLHHFLRGWGKQLAPLATILPPGAEAITPEDCDTLRFCARAAGGSGFLFINNFQDHAERRDQDGIVLSIETPDGPLRLPHHGTLTIKKDACMVLSVNLEVAGTGMEYAIAQFLALIELDGASHLFTFAPEGIQPEYCFHTGAISNIEGDLQVTTAGDRIILRPRVGRESSFQFSTPGGSRVVVTTLSRVEAESAWLGRAWGRDRLILSPGGLEFMDGGLRLSYESGGPQEISIYPPVADKINCAGAELDRSDTLLYTSLRLTYENSLVACLVTSAGKNKFAVEIPEAGWQHASDLYLSVDYEGDAAMAFIGGDMVADNFNNGTAWVIGLKRFRNRLAETPIVLVFQPLRKGAVKNVSSTVAARFEFEGQEKLAVNEIRLIQERHIMLMPAEESAH